MCSKSCPSLPLTRTRKSPKAVVVFTDNPPVPLLLVPPHFFFSFFPDLLRSPFLLPLGPSKNHPFPPLSRRFRGFWSISLFLHPVLWFDFYLLHLPFLYLEAMICSGSVVAFVSVPDFALPLPILFPPATPFPEKVLYVQERKWQLDGSNCLSIFLTDV